jgi:hypothetical protein
MDNGRKMAGSRFFLVVTPSGEGADPCRLVRQVKQIAG